MNSVPAPSAVACTDRPTFQKKSPPRLLGQCRPTKDGRRDSEAERRPLEGRHEGLSGGGSAAVTLAGGVNQIFILVLCPSVISGLCIKYIGGQCHPVASSSHSCRTSGLTVADCWWARDSGRDRKRPPHCRSKAVHPPLRGRGGASGVDAQENKGGGARGTDETDERGGSACVQGRRWQLRWACVHAREGGSLRARGVVAMGRGGGASNLWRR